MKKLLLFMLVLVGGVGQTFGAKLYVNTATNASWWTNVRIYAYNSDSDNNGWGYSESGVVATPTTLFGKEWYVFDMGDYSNAVVQYFESSNHSISNQSTNITGITHDKFIFIPGTQTDGKWVWYENGFTCRNNVEDNWSLTSCNMDVVNSNTLSYTFTKSTIDASGVDKIWFRILNQEGQIYPNAEGTTIDIAGNTSDYYNNWDGTSWSFGINKPSFDYDKIVITASLSGTTWTIKADAYIAKTITAVGYATFGSAAAVNFSGVTGLTAQKAKVNKTTGHITYTDATTLAANEGALLSGEAKTYYIPVAASATADTENNDLVAVTEQKEGFKGDYGYNCYILTNKTVDGDAELGFYKINATSGNTLKAGSAYLKVDASSPARQFFPLTSESETTGINSVAEQGESANFYNLAGQRVAQPAKGLYIVNGKKVIIK